MSAAAELTASFVREHLRARLTLVLLVLIPVVFVIASASVLGEFAEALGGSVAGDSATSLGAGWAAAFLAGVLGFFQVASARDADRRLALAGIGAARVAGARIAASITLGAVVSAAAYATLWLRAGIEHPVHAGLAIFAFALTYIGIGVLVGSLISSPLEGSLAVSFVFLVDAFSGPGMSEGGGIGELMPTRNAAELLISAGAGRGSPWDEWGGTAAVGLAALAIAFTAFWLSARPRS